MTQSRLVTLLLLFFTAVALPTSILVYQAYGQLKWEAFYQHQQLARELTLRIDSEFRKLIEREESRPTSDYEFLNISGSTETAFLQRSPLSQFPLEVEVPGLLGYFQVDSAGQLRTPIVPESNAVSYGISSAELQQREQQQAQLQAILGRNRLVGKSDLVAAPAPADPALEEALDAPMSSDLVVADPELDALGSSAISDDRQGSGQSVFDELAARKQNQALASSAPAEQVKDLKLEDNYRISAAETEAAEDAELQRLEPRKQAETRRLRKEKIILPQAVQSIAEASREDGSKATAETKDADSAEKKRPESTLGEGTVALNQAALGQQMIRIQTFETEVEPMEFALLDSGHFVLFRRVWQNNERYVQGILVQQADFIDGLIVPAFRESSLSAMSRLIVAYRGSILKNLSADYSRRYQPASEQASNELLYQNRLVAPFGDMELIYTLARLPVGAGGQVIIWSAVVLAIVLIGGCLMLLRLGQRQLALARQQQDFVSAVSHELKTPLTSIRMYGEMLREGWADESKRKSYYDFIFFEAERLTRLINNVLQLARLSRNEAAGTLVPMTVAEVLAELRPRLQSQLEASGFELSINGEAEVGDRQVNVDIDSFIQIFINLVDNAVKFSANAGEARIDLGCQQMQDGRIQFSVRDYGPGIEPDQMKKIFKLFYRSENELTRETVGTGIGLALVQQLAESMHAQIDVVNCNPGVEFRLRIASLATNG